MNEYEKWKKKLQRTVHNTRSHLVYAKSSYSACYIARRRNTQRIRKKQTECKVRLTVRPYTPNSERGISLRWMRIMSPGWPQGWRYCFASHQPNCYISIDGIEFKIQWILLNRAHHFYCIARKTANNTNYEHNSVKFVESQTLFYRWKYNGLFDALSWCVSRNSQPSDITRDHT